MPSKSESACTRRTQRRTAKGKPRPATGAAHQQTTRKPSMSSRRTSLNNLVLAKTVADRLECGHAIAGGEGIVQRFVSDVRLGDLTLDPFVAADAQFALEAK